MSFVLNASGSNFGSCFINLNPYPERRDPKLSGDAIAASLRKDFDKHIFDAQVAVFGPPPVRGVGRAGGFAVMIEDRGDLGPGELQNQIRNLADKGNNVNRQGQDIRLSPEQQEKLEQARKLIAASEGTTHPNLSPEQQERLEQARKLIAEADLKLKPALVIPPPVFRANVPQMRVEVDPSAAMIRGVNLQAFANTLSVYEGSLYVNDFNKFGRTWQVIVQAEPAFRRQPENLPPLRTRNSRGAVVPLGSLAEQREVTGPLVLTRYNMYPAAAINGVTLPGVSSGQGIDLVQLLAKADLPRGMTYEWTDMSYLELLAGSTAMIIFGCAVVMVFLVLAAQYESWSLPLAVILVVPMCLLSAIMGVRIAVMDINIFTQIGFVVLVGLASKNAILIVEFAKHRHEEGGLSRRDATLAACRLRLRPIVMTSFAFILGVLPMLISTGAGAEMRRTLGTAVFSGMVGVTLFGIVLTPVFFFVIEWLSETPLFNSPLMRRVNDVSLGILLAVAYPWRLYRLVRRSGKLRRPTPTADGNGQPVQASSGNGAAPEPAVPAQQQPGPDQVTNGEPDQVPPDGPADSQPHKPQAPAREHKPEVGRIANPSYPPATGPEK
jgi:multidrug efflux pump